MSQPQKSVSTFKQKTNSAYEKMTTTEKLEYDLAQQEKREKELKVIMNSRGYNSKKLNKYIESIVGKYDPTIQYIQNTRYSGKDLISIRISENKFRNQYFTVNQIKRISNKLSNKLQQKGIIGNQATALIYGDLNWKSGYFKALGEDTVLYDPNLLYNLQVPYEEPDKIPAFNIYIALGNKAEGGADDKFNDCLYRCLKYYVFNIEEYFKSAVEFKKLLGLKRGDKVPLDKIDIIESKLKTYQINVRGDYIRTSTINSNKEINLILTNEHYEVEKVNRRLTPYLKFEEKLPLIFDQKTLEVYDGLNKWKLTKEERSKVQNKNSKYILVYRLKPKRDKNGILVQPTIEEEYKQFISSADKLKEETNGLINLYKSGSHHHAALDLFDRLTKSIKTEAILQDESIWIKNSSFSALIYSEKGYQGEVYGYDVKSLYPHLMSLSTLKFPVKRGEFKNIDEFNKDYFEYGIYRCVINPSQDEKINNLFKFNKNNYYTSIDLTNAKNLGLTIELTKDTKPNFLYYSRDKVITFGEVFKQYVNILFPLKEKKISNAKDILNILWGSLCEIDKRKTFITSDFNIKDDEEICEIYPKDEGHMLKTTKLNNYYKTQFARLCPFLIGQGRKTMSDKLFDEREYIHRISTDGVLLSKQLHTNKDVKLGEFKYEGYNPNAEIKTCINKVELV